MIRIHLPNGKRLEVEKYTPEEATLVKLFIEWANQTDTSKMTKEEIHNVFENFKKQANK